MTKWLKITLYFLGGIVLVLILVNQLNSNTTAPEIDRSKGLPEKGMPQAAAAKPNAQRDLVLKEFSWQKGSNGATGLHSFSIYNASTSYDYKTITVRFSYYSEIGDEVGRVDKVIDKAIKAGETIRVDKVETELRNQHADGADMKIIK